MKRLIYSLCLVASCLVSRAQEIVVTLELGQPLTLMYNENNGNFCFLKNLQDTIQPLKSQSDTLTYFTDLGRLQVYQSQNALHYHYHGHWKQAKTYDLATSGKQNIQSSFYRDDPGNIAWLRWSRFRKMPLLYSPYQHYQSYLVALQNGAYLNAHGDQIILTENEIRYREYATEKVSTFRHFEPFIRKEVYVLAHGDSLFGYYYQPTGKSQFPACLLLQGGGSEGLDNYTPEAEFFAAHGMATVVFNKSGEGRSRGSTFFRNQSFTDKLDEYEVLFSWLAEQTGVDRECMGIHGMSEGGRLSVDLAARLGKRVAFVNSVAAPFASYADNQLYAIRHFMQQSLVEDSLIAATTYAWSRYFRERANGSLSASTRKMITGLRQRHSRLYLPSLAGDDLVKENINYESIGSLAKVTCPVLFQWGANDERVDAVRSIAFIREHRQNKLDWLRSYPESSHSFTDRWMNTSQGYFADKIGWLRSLQILTP